MPQPVIYEKASVLCYRIFDIAEEIHLQQAQKLLSEGARRLRLSREGSEYLQLPNPPLVVDLGKRALPMRKGALTVEAIGRVFDHGAASIILKVPVVPGCTEQELIVLADELYDSASVEQLALELIEVLRKTIAPAVEGPHLWNQNESYSIIFAEKINGDPSAAELLERADIARLLLGEVSNLELSARERYEVTQHHFSYTERDLVIVDWNSAFVYEPSGSMDIPDILEICNAQLLEFRYFDDVLDGHIRRTYDQMQHQARKWYSILRSPYRSLTRRVLVTLLEMSEFIERVDNSLKIIGDFYLAKVYDAGLKRLRIAVWQASVTRKQQMLAHVYQLLKGELDTDRSLTLEATIVVLIVSEILLAFGTVIR